MHKNEKYDKTVMFELMGEPGWVGAVGRMFKIFDWLLQVHVAY
jgi:hypothetical protein